MLKVWANRHGCREVDGIHWIPLNNIHWIVAIKDLSKLGAPNVMSTLSSDQRDFVSLLFYSLPSEQEILFSARLNSSIQLMDAQPIQQFVGQISPHEKSLR